jgi:hypothetical protein
MTGIRISYRYRLQVVLVSVTILVIELRSMLAKIEQIRWLEELLLLLTGVDNKLSY